jgi:N-acyl-phosphatidylethanolamine-hydrolysing phospholipase D
MASNTIDKAAATSIISVNSKRSAAELQELVKRRVQERNSWTINGVTSNPTPPAKETLKFLANWILRPPEIPSQAELDEKLPVLPIDWKKLQSPALDTIQVTWLGHASVLVQMNGCNIVTDPVFSQRCSPSQLFGPKRYRPAPCSIQELCSKIDVDFCLISHNHYDHLDYATVRDLWECSTSKFIVPLGLREWFYKHVSKDVPIYELDWNETVENKATSVRVTSVGMRHWSNRIGDRDKTLWCGYSIQAGKHKFLFPGDTAWFDALQDLGKTHGPYDVAAIPIGAYAPRDFMKFNHINVDEALRMKDAVRAKVAIPIHWGTFPLTTEPALEPRDKLIECMSGRHDSDTFVPWLIGETKQF